LAKAKQLKREKCKIEQQVLHDKCWIQQAIRNGPKNGAGKAEKEKKELDCYCIDRSGVGKQALVKTERSRRSLTIKSIKTLCDETKVNLWVRTALRLSIVSPATTRQKK
jgi:hypothetical protein